MDGTIFLSTTRHGLEHKLALLTQFCVDNCMLVNDQNANFFGIHGSGREREPFRVGEIVVEWCDKFVYLGGVPMIDGTLSSAITPHS